MMNINNFYCRKICSDLDFSIDEYNETSKALDATNLTEVEKIEILHPSACEKQCFDCMADVGETRLKTQKLIQKKVKV